MRPGQNKRLRGRNNNNNNSNNNNNRKGPNPLTRSYESNGPDVKVRGTAQHIAEKYLQLARDAQSSGDPVMAESYLQHAEHYYRLIAAAHAAQQSAMGYARAAPVELDIEEEDITTDRFASVTERLPAAAFPSAPVNGGGNAQNYPNAASTDQPAAPGPAYPNEAGAGEERAEAQPPVRQNRYERSARYESAERPPRQERPERQERPARQERPERSSGYRNAPRRPRDPYRENAGRNEYFEDNGAAKAAEELPDPTAPASLPAFITAPVRVPAPAETASENAYSHDDEPQGGYHLRPRRRRRPPIENGPQTSGPSEAE